MRNRLTKLVRDTRGATAIEYALIAGLIFVAMVAGVSALGGKTGGAWTNLSNAVVTNLPAG